MPDEVTLTRAEVETLTGYMDKMDSAAREQHGAAPDPNDDETAVLAKLEAVVTSPPSDSYTQK